MIWIITPHAYRWSPHHQFLVLDLLICSDFVGLKALSSKATADIATQRWQQSRTLLSHSDEILSPPLGFSCPETIKG